MKISKVNLRNLFTKGLKPNQEAYWNWMDSFWHKDEEIDPSSVKNLEITLANKLDKGVETTLLNAFNDAVANVNSIIKGEATPSSSPTAWVPGDQPLYEKWEARTVGTYTNFKDSSGQAIEITNDDLDKKFVFINMTNGVAKMNKVAIPGVMVAPKFDRNNSIDAQSGKEIATEYDYLKEINKGYFENKIPSTPDITSINTADGIYGGWFLNYSNEISQNTSYPEFGVFHNLDTSNCYQLRIKDMNNFAPGDRPAILGVKNDGTLYNILLFTDPDISAEKIIDLTDTKFLSFQLKQGISPVIELFNYEQNIISSKEYFEKKLSVLDSFLNPTEITWQNLTMPLPNENVDKILATDWSQYAAPGFFNGRIIFSDLPPDAKYLKVTGNFNNAGAGVLWIGAFKNFNPVAQLLAGTAGSGSKVFELDHNLYDIFAYSRTVDIKFEIGRIVKKPLQKDSVKDFIENHISNGSSISNEKSAQIKRPSKVLRLDFTTSDPLPATKDTIATGEILISDMEGLGIKKVATLAVQGSSSALYPKKNWTIGLFNNSEKTSEFKLRVGNWAFHSEFVFKSNWIDATHTRNLISNYIWEDIVQSRKYYPKRENEIAYSASYTSQIGRFDSGALCHVDGVPAELYVNGVFYGIGSFNLGKKRENYDLKSSNQNHIQLAAETHADFFNYNAAEWEIRNPKTPDASFQTKINAWFASNALTGQAFKDSFETNHDLKNAIDFYLLAELIQSPDMYTKNLMVTSWDALKFYFLPYDMDTTFGLQWDGSSFTGHTTSIRSTTFWQKFYNAYTADVKARYLDLKNSGIFTLNNVYRHADRINKMYGVELYQKEQSTWPTVPSNSTIYAGFPQLYDWVKKRIEWLDTQYL